MTHYIGVECSAKVFYDVIVKVEGDMDKKEANKIAYEKVRDSLRNSKGQLDIDRSCIDDNELDWEVEGTSRYDYNDGYGVDFVVGAQDDRSDKDIPGS